MGASPMTPRGPMGNPLGGGDNNNPFMNPRSPRKDGKKRE